MVDDLHGDAAGFGFVEGTGNIAVQAHPCFLVDFRLQCRLQCFKGYSYGEFRIGFFEKTFSMRTPNARFAFVRN